jgi:hypothetical protein
MKSKTLTFVGGIVLLAALAAPARLSAQKQIHYTVIEIGTLPAERLAKHSELTTTATWLVIPH